MISIIPTQFIRDSILLQIIKTNDFYIVKSDQNKYLIFNGDTISPLL